MRILPSEWACLVALALHAALVISLCICCGPWLGVVCAFPLLVSLRGLSRQNTYTAKWSSLCLCLYVGGFLVEAYAIPAHRAIATRLSVVGVLDFMALVLFVRWRRLEVRGVVARMESSGGAVR